MLTCLLYRAIGRAFSFWGLPAGCLFGRKRCFQVANAGRAIQGNRTLISGFGVIFA